jgi:hypothetical protein
MRAYYYSSSLVVTTAIQIKNAKRHVIGTISTDKATATSKKLDSPILFSYIPIIW